MNKIYKDTDLREALRRKYSDVPQLPADFMAKMEERLDAKPVAKSRHQWRWVAAAACVLIMLGIGFTMLHKDDELRKPLLAETTVKPSREVAKVEKGSEVQKKQQETTEPHIPVSLNRQRTASPQTINQETVGNEQIAAPHETEPLSDPNIHYAANEHENDTIPYQDPARVDEFIAKLADFYNVRQGELKCSASNDSNMVSTVYVFPDKKEIDVFARLLQVACWYKSETSGYRLNFSHQQFLFELKDMRRKLQYRWIAERINGRILLYGTNAPIGVTESSACYQEYRNELMHINSINNKTKKI